jgi:hypothetical protein
VRIIGLAAAALLLSLGTPVEAAFPWHTFDTDSQGWRYAGSGSDYGGPTSIGDTAGWDLRGNPGGALSAPDLYYQTWVAAPADFLGNQSDMFGRAFTYDMFVRASDNVPYAGICITGGGLSLIYNGFVPQVGVWETRAVTFESANWRIDTTTGPLVTDEQLQSVLGSMDGLYLCTEWVTGSDDTSIDNVGVVPEPMTALLVLPLVALLRRR